MGTTDSKYGVGLDEKIKSLQASTPKTAPPTDSGGITISTELLPDVKEGDTVTLIVNSVDPDKHEVHLSVQ